MIVATFLFCYFATAVAVSLAVGRAVRLTREPDPGWMGWRCAECGAAFPHGRSLVRHLLAEHPEATPVSRETRPAP